MLLQGGSKQRTYLVNKPDKGVGVGGVSGLTGVEVRSVRRLIHVESELVAGDLEV